MALIESNIIVPLPEPYVFDQVSRQKHNRAHKTHFGAKEDVIVPWFFSFNNFVYPILFKVQVGNTFRPSRKNDLPVPDVADALSTRDQVQTRRDQWAVYSAVLRPLRPGRSLERKRVQSTRQKVHQGPRTVICAKLPFSIHWPCTIEDTRLLLRILVILLRFRYTH